MSQKTYKAIRDSAKKYAVREERNIARYQQSQIYSLPFFSRLCYALGVIFKWGNDGSRKDRDRHGSRLPQKAQST
jgi:hypothetical protein